MNTRHNPKISIIMPVNNGLPFLKAAVESILNQSFKDFEFIIVEDSSTDRSLEYLKSIRDKRVKILKNPKNMGVAKSLNRALRAASGQYIARMDADDTSLPQRLQTQLKFMINHPQVDICGSWVNIINKKGQLVGNKKPVTEYNQIKKALSWYSPVIHPTFFAKRKFYEGIKGYDQNFDLAEDYELLVRAKDRFKIANVPEVLLNLRIWGNRRSAKSMHEIDKKDLSVKINALKKGYFGPLYLFTIIRKIIMTYLIPWELKLKIANSLNIP